MIKSVIATNYLGESVKMGIGDPDDSGLLISSIEGIGPGPSDISITELAATDGAVYNSARIASRNIVLNIIFQESKLLDDSPMIEDSRYLSYRIFPLKKPINLIVVTDNRSLQIDGYVESNEPAIFEAQSGTTISIICPNPFFYSLTESNVVFSGIRPLFEFPFCNDSLTEKRLIFGEIADRYENVVIYEGDVETGVVINIHFLGPATGITIYNVVTGATMKINTDKLAAIVGSQIQAVDDLIISTVTGKKSITFWRNGKSYNVLNCLERDSDWLKLDVGRNILAYIAETGFKNLQFNIDYYPLFEGV